MITRVNNPAVKMKKNIIMKLMIKFLNLVSNLLNQNSMKIMKDLKIKINKNLQYWIIIIAFYINFIIIAFYINFIIILSTFLIIQSTFIIVQSTFIIIQSTFIRFQSIFIIIYTIFIIPQSTFIIIQSIFI